MTSSAEIRRTFLDYFAAQGHTVVPSSSLLPGNDPTLLFTNAGMVQFKDVFLGTEKRSYTRAATAQKCMRVSGKHNDLENVGPSTRHHTFFEMLGNFSFGDYFKREAIAFAWEFLTQKMMLDPSRLHPTVYLEDDEAADLWPQVTGLPPERITRLGKKDNFWSMGDTGPNGPCSEIIYDRGPEYCTCGRPDCNLALECDRWWELWNLVFMQFETTSDGVTRPLPRPSIDTGMGFERLTAVMQGKDNNYATDLFWPIIRKTQEMLGHSDAQRDAQLVSYRVISDHARAIAFLIADGVLPGNEGRSYVLRLILRRAARHGKMLGFAQPFMSSVIEAVMDIMGSYYQELLQRRDFILRAVTQEEERFLQTLDTGLNLLQESISTIKAAGGESIPGDEVFRLYDTYGFPLDLTRDVAKEQGLTVDEAGFRAAMDVQRERGRAAMHFEPEREQELLRSLNLPATVFTGYQSGSGQARVLTLLVDGQVRDAAATAEDVEVILDQSPFYAEGGGQVGDSGIIVSPHGRIEVHDARHPIAGLIVHMGHVVEGTVRSGEQVEAIVDESRRLDIARNHTATHLLHHALRSVLGDHARQAGSLVAPDRLRFDFTHLQPVSPSELRQIEREVNAAVRADLGVHSDVSSYQQARDSGAIALFGEKYGDTVRVVGVGDDYSRELCGGTHLRSTGQIGLFKIISESSIGSGLRRIEAVTGRAAEEYIERQLDLLSQAADVIEVQAGDLPQKVRQLGDQLRQQQREVEQLRGRTAQETALSLLSAVESVHGVQVLASQVNADSVDRMREMIDVLRDKLPSAVLVLVSCISEKPVVVAAVTPDLIARGIHAGKLVAALAKIVNGGGGGRPDLAQAGGREAGKIPDLLREVPHLIEGLL